MPTSALIAGLGAGAGALGSYFGGQAAAAASDRAAALQAQIRAQNQQIEDPYIQGGQRNFDIYNNATGANGSSAQSNFFNNFKTDPAYSGVLAAGTNAVANSAAARGTMYGGNTARDINDYGGNLLQNAYNSRISQLYQGAALGGTAANSLVNSNTTSGAYQGQAMQQAGQYQGNALVGAANAGVAGLNNYNALNRYNNPYGPDRTRNGYSTNMNDYGGAPTYTDNYANLGTGF